MVRVKSFIMLAPRVVAGRLSGPHHVGVRTTADPRCCQRGRPGRWQETNAIACGGYFSKRFFAIPTGETTLKTHRISLLAAVVDPRWCIRWKS